MFQFPEEVVSMTRKSIPSDARGRSASEPSLEQAQELAGMFHLLGDVNRLRLICTCLDEPVCVQDLADRFRLTPSLVSQHLRLLKAARLMRAERRGKQVFYTVIDEHVRAVLRTMTSHVAEISGDES